MNKLVLALLLLSVPFAPALASDDVKQIDTPKSVVVLQQSQGFNGITVLSAADAETGDLLVAYIQRGRVEWYKTGATVDLAKQSEVSKK